MRLPLFDGRSHPAGTLLMARIFAALALFLAWLPGLFAAESAPAKPPRRVTVGFNLRFIPSIQEPDETFTAICYLHLRWHEPSLVVPGGTRQVLLGDEATAKVSEVGRPGISFINETTAAEANHVVLTISPDGTVDYDREFEVTLRSELDLRSFPFDRQVLQIDLESYAYPASELILEPNPDQMKIGRIRLPQWEVGKLNWSTTLVEEELEKDKYSRVSITLEVVRKPGFYVWQVFVPLFILIMIASTVFFLPAEDLSDRISVITTSLLTAVALSYTVHTDLPKISYLTSVDRLFVTAYVFLGAKIVGMLIVRHLVEQHAERARKIDRIARWAFPCVYLTTNTVIILLSMARG